MDFDNFTDIIRDNIRNYLPDSYENAEITVKDIEKLNGNYRGLVVQQKDDPIAPSLDLGHFYQEFTDQNRSMIDIMDEMSEIIMTKHPEINIAGIENFEHSREHLYIRVSGLERNMEILKNRPYTVQDNLAITYHVDLGRNQSVSVTNSLMNSWGISQEQLHEAAMENSAKIRPATVRSLNAVMSEMMQMPMDTIEDNGLTLVSNKQMVEGASALFYPRTMEQIAERFHDSFYVLPSSIHEMLVLPETGAPDVNELCNMVREVNETQVIPEEQLTDDVYHYDSQSKIFEKATAYLARVKGAERNVPEPYIDFFVTDNSAAPEKGRTIGGLTLNEAVKTYESASVENPGTCGIGFQLFDGSPYNHPFVMMADGQVLEEEIGRVNHFRENPLVQKAVTDLKGLMGERNLTKEHQNKKGNAGMTI